MALDGKQLANALGLDESILEMDEEKALTEFKAKYISREVAHQDDELVKKITGSRFGALETSILREFDLPAADFKGKKVEEILKAGTEKIKGRIGELETQLAAGNPDIEKLTKDLNAWKEKAGVFERQLGETKSEYDKRISEMETGFKKERIAGKLNALKSQVSFIEPADESQKPIIELAKRGYEQDLHSRYNFDLDEQGELVVLDKNSKGIERKKGGGFYSPLEALTLLAEENKLLKMNNADPAKKIPGIGGGGSEKAVRTSNPAAQKHLETLKK